MTERSSCAGSQHSLRRWRSSVSHQFPKFRKQSSSQAVRHAVMYVCMHACMYHDTICNIATMARIGIMEVHECAYCHCRVSHPIGAVDPNGGRYCHLGWYYCGQCWEMWQHWWDRWCFSVSEWVFGRNRQGLTCFAYSQICMYI